MAKPCPHRLVPLVERLGAAMEDAEGGTQEEGRKLDQDGALIGCCEKTTTDSLTVAVKHW
jgi:hypothetical protein